MNQTEGQMLLDLLKRKGKKISPILKKLDIDPATFYRHVKKPSMPEYMLEMIENEIGYKLKENETKTTTKKDTSEQIDPFWPLAENTARIIAIAKQFQDELKEVRNNVAEHTDQIRDIVKTIGELNKVDGRLEKELKELRELIQAH